MRVSPDPTPTVIGPAPARFTVLLTISGAAAVLTVMPVVPVTAPVRLSPLEPVTVSVLPPDRLPRE